MLVNLTVLNHCIIIHGAKTLERPFMMSYLTYSDVLCKTAIRMFVRCTFSKAEHYFIL